MRISYYFLILHFLTGSEINRSCPNIYLSHDTSRIEKTNTDILFFYHNSSKYSSL